MELPLSTGINISLPMTEIHTILEIFSKILPLIMKFLPLKTIDSLTTEELLKATTRIRMILINLRLKRTSKMTIIIVIT